MGGTPSIGLLDWGVAIVLTAFVIAPLATLAHELGHAAVALLLGRGRVSIVVGHPGFSVTGRAGRLQVTCSPLPANGVSHAGVCICEQPPRGRRAAIALLLAGPLMTFACLVALTWAALASLDAPGWQLATLVCGALDCLCQLLVNLDPRREPHERPGELRRDGPRAVALARAAAPAPAQAGTDIAEPHEGTSVAPPRRPR